MISQQVWEILLRQVVQVTIVIALFGAIARIFRRWPHVAYVLWLVVLIKSLTPPIWSSPTSIFSWIDFHRAEAWTQVVASQPVLAQPTPAQPALVEDDGVFATSTAMQMAMLPAAPAVARPAVHRSIALWQVMLAIWAVGGCGMMLLVALHWLVLRRRIERSSVRPSTEMSRIVLELRQELGLRRPIRLRVCNGSIGPAVIGALRPMLVIPAGLLQDKPLTQIRAILAHEMIHLRRGDPLVGGVQILSQAIWWFHPLAWWMNRRISRVREMCCDAEALASLRCPPADYAQMLIDVLRLRRSFGLPMLSLGVHPMQVTTQRLRQIMNGSRSSGKRMPWRYWALAGLCALVILPGAGCVLRGDENGSQPRPSDVRWDGYPRLAPFDAIQWNGTTPQVRVKGTWYELQAVNDVKASDIMSYSAQLNPELAKKHFGEDLVELMTLMGHAPGNSVTLQVKDLSSGKEQTLKDIPMTAENRAAVLAADLGQDKRITLTGDRISFQTRHFVRVVVGKTGIMFQGKEINLDELPGQLLDVPDSASTVVELAVASDDVTVGQFDKVQAVAAKAVQRMGFEYLSYIGKQDANSMGSPDETIVAGPMRAIVWGQGREVNGLAIPNDPYADQVAVALAAAQLRAAKVAAESAALSAAPPLPAPQSQLTHIVNFQIGESGFHPGDSITITQVRGTSDQFAVDGTYQVTGRYTLTSRDHAVLALSLTAKDPQNARGSWGKWQTMKIDRGQGTFTLTERMPCEGSPHVSFYDGSSFGEIYFGTGDWVSY